MDRLCLPMALVTSVLVLVFAPGASAAPEPELVDMIPEEKAGWTPRNVFAGASTIVTGPSYWYKDKIVDVETVPANAQLGLYFIRSNFQKKYERAVAPIRIKTPRRILSTSRDVIAVRAAAPGFLTKEVKFRVHDVPDKLVINLEPLPNALVFLGQTHLAGRSTIVLRTTEEPDLRVSRPRGGDSFTLALAKTANKLEGDPAVGGGHVKKLSVDQIGEDLMIRVKSDQDGLEVRSKNSYDPIRKEHVYVLDVMQQGSRPPSTAQVRSEIEQVSYQRGSACNSAFEQTLRRRLDPQMLARAFRPAGGLAEFYQREAMLRLGRLNSGSVRTVSGDAFRTGSPIELAMALQDAGKVQDYLGMLGAIAQTQPDPAGFLRALIAPELAPDEFEAIYREAVAARSACG